MKKRLTLKELKTELDIIKNKNSEKLNIEITLRNKIDRTSKIKNLIMKPFKQSSMFTLYLVSGILAYAHKLPLLSKIINILTFW